MPVELDATIGRSMPLYADGISNLAAATGITSKEDKSIRMAWYMAEIAGVAPTESIKCNVGSNATAHGINHHRTLRWIVYRDFSICQTRLALMVGHSGAIIE